MLEERDELVLLHARLHLRFLLSVLSAVFNVPENPWRDRFRFGQRGDSTPRGTGFHFDRRELGQPQTPARLTQRLSRHITMMSDQF